MNQTMFDLYKIAYRGKKYRVLLPGETGQFWAINKKDGGCFWQEMNFYGNRQGIEALEHGCAALAGDDPVIVYIPCRKNRDICQIFSFFQVESWMVEASEEFLDLVLMKPGTLKICDWKGIRACLAKTKPEKWSVRPENVLKYRKVKEKYNYRDEKKKVIRFDTLFYNFPHYEYLMLASRIRQFLEMDREKEFLEDIQSGGRRLRGEEIFSLLDKGAEEVWLSFWDCDIFQKEQERKQKEQTVRCQPAVQRVNVFCEQERISG